MTTDAGTVPSPEEQLRRASLRVTAPRLAVLTAVGSLPHADVETITAAVRLSIGSVSTQAVYDVLKALASANLVRRIEPAGSPALYETRVGDNHHHVICRQCGTVADVDCVVGHAPCLQPSPTHGFSIDEAEVVLWGLCADCRQPVAAQHDPDHPA